MGSCSDSIESRLTGDTKTRDQETLGLEPRKISQNCVGERERNKGNESTHRKETLMGNITRGDEDHIVIKAENTKVENEIIQTENKLKSRKDYISESNYNNDVNNSVNARKETNAEDKDDLKGEFAVYEKPDEEDFVLSEAGAELTAIEKSLTLTVCHPNLLSSVSRQNEKGDSSSGVIEIYNENFSNEEHVENKESVNDSHFEDVNSNAVQEKTPEEIYIGDESTKRNSLKTTISNNSDENRKRGASLTDRFPASSRTNSKHGSSRSPRQATVPEMDESSEAEDVLNSVERVGHTKSNDVRGNSINHKKPWKHQNKSVGRNKDPMREDLYADYSHTKNSLLNQEKSSRVRPASAHPDIRRSGAPVTNNDKIQKPNRCPRVHSFVSNIPHANEQGDTRQLGISFDCASSADFPNVERRRDGGFTSVYQRRYTKLELRKALPRKSFFSCHEKAMKDAGLEIEDPASKRKAERLKAKLERIAKEFDPLPSQVVLETGKGNNTLQTHREYADPSIVVTHDKSNVVDPNKKEDSRSSDAHESYDITSGDMVDGMLKADLSTAVHYLSKKKRLHAEKSDNVECKPLVHYLEYIKENQSEYENYRNTSNGIANNKPITRLISLGRAFELRHCGGSPKTKSDDVMVMAAKALRPRSSDSSRYYKREQDKSSGLRGHDSSLRQTRPPSDDKRRQEKNASTANASKDEEHAKTELERKKIRAEEWAMSVSTNTLTRAKIQSLRELGSDDDELTKWWIALRRCHYLRVRGLAEESS